MNNGGGGDIANYGQVPSSTHIWIANNQIKWTWGSDREVTTFDGGGSGYTGTHRSSEYDRPGSLPIITLSMPILDASLRVNGWALFVLDGPGSGQYRRVVQALSRTELVLDTLFVGLVPGESLLQLVPMRGQVIMYHNYIADTGVLQFCEYGVSVFARAAHISNKSEDAKSRLMLFYNCRCRWASDGKHRGEPHA